MKILLAFLCLAVTTAYGFVCAPNICSAVRCAGIKAEDCNGRVDPRGGYCGCCPSCVVQVGVNERCISSLLLLGIPQNAECAEGLYCNKTMGVCQNKTCAMKLADIQNGKHLLGTPLPKCEADGTYSPVQCAGSVCYCVNSTGGHLYQDYFHRTKPYQAAIGEQDSMNCQCPREQQDYIKAGNIGNFYVCVSNGNYEKVGCSGSICYCRDVQGKPVWKTSVNFSQKDSLNC